VVPTVLIPCDGWFGGESKGWLHHSMCEYNKVAVSSAGRDVVLLISPSEPIIKQRKEEGSLINRGKNSWLYIILQWDNGGVVVAVAVAVAVADDDYYYGDSITEEAINTSNNRFVVLSITQMHHLIISNYSNQIQKERQRKRQYKSSCEWNDW